MQKSPAYPHFLPATAPGTLRHRLFTIIFEADTPLGKAFDVGLLYCILVSVLVVMLDSVDLYARRFSTAFHLLEWLFTIVFTIEYALRLWSVRRPLRYALSFFGLVDLISIIPTYLSLLLSGANVLLIVRVFRILRVFRVLKLAQFSSQANLLMRAIRGSRHKIAVFFTFVAAVVTTFGCLMYLIEGRENGFTSIPRSIYWAIVTLTTVGYGDLYPHTNLGQMLAALVMITGYAVIAVPTGIFTAELTSEIRRERQLRSCSRCNKPDHDANALYCSQCGAPLAQASADDDRTQE